jgi:hypothetical protein
MAGFELLGVSYFVPVLLVRGPGGAGCGDSFWCVASVLVQEVPVVVFIFLPLELKGLCSA